MPTRESLSSDWLTVKEAMHRYRISRSRLYSLMEEPTIRTFCLKRRGRVKGIRFFSMRSLDAYFEEQCRMQRS